MSRSPSREPSLPVVETKLLEPVKLTWADAGAAAAKAGALAIGPGLGRDAAAKALRDELLAAGEQKLVLDADALHELEPGEWGARAVLTPHAGELAGSSARAPAGWTRTVSRPPGAAPSGSAASACSRAPTRSSPRPLRASSSCSPRRRALATAGTGDVLTGILAAFLAKGLDPRLGAAAAATAHGLAARLLPQRGLVAGDIISALPAVLA